MNHHMNLVSSHDETTYGDTKLESSHLDHVDVAVVPVSAYAVLDTRQTWIKFRKTAMICACALFIACTDGFAFSLPGNLVANDGFIARMGEPEVTGGPNALSAEVIGAWGGVHSGGYIFGLLVGGFPCDYLGRRFNMGLIVGFLATACIVEMVAKDWKVWTAAKLLAGIATGLTQLTLTTFVSELAPPQIRGGLLSLYSFFFALGQLACAIATYVIQETAPMDYLKTVYSEWVFIGIAIIIIILIPESPRWLLTTGRRDKAVSTLLSLNKSIKDYDVELELSVLQYDIDQEKALHEVQKNSRWIDMFKGVNLRRTWVSFSVLGWQQLLGIPIVFGYTSLFFQLAGLANAFLGTLIINFILLFFIITSSWVVERFGRRPMLISGGITMIVMLAGIGGCGFLPEGNGAKGPVIIVLMAIWVAAYASSAGPLGYVYLGESSNINIRAKTTGFAAACSGIFGLIFNYSTPFMLTGSAKLGIKAGLIYAGLAAFGFVFIFFTVPEFRGRTYAELNELFERRIPSRKFAETKTAVDELKALQQGVNA